MKVQVWQQIQTNNKCLFVASSATSPSKHIRVGSSAGGKTLAKSRLLPAMPNPRFDLSFQLDNPESVPRQTALVFEIRSSIKEVVAACRITLQDMLSGGMIPATINLNLVVTIYITLLSMFLRPSSSSSPPPLPCHLTPLLSPPQSYNPCHRP